MSQNPEAVPAFQAKDVLVDYLSRCQAAVARCLKQAEDHDDPEQAMAAARLIKTSIDLVGAIEGKPATTHRLLIERPSAE